jgi:hypothetical protein
LFGSTPVPASGAPAAVARAPSPSGPSGAPMPGFIAAGGGGGRSAAPTGRHRIARAKSPPVTAAMPATLGSAPAFSSSPQPVQSRVQSPVQLPVHRSTVGGARHMSPSHETAYQAIASLPPNERSEMLLQLWRFESTERSQRLETQDRATAAIQAIYTAIAEANSVAAQAAADAFSNTH